MQRPRQVLFSGEALDFYDVEKFIVDEEALQLQYVIM